MPRRTPNVGDVSNLTQADARRQPGRGGFRRARRPTVTGSIAPGVVTSFDGPAKGPLVRMAFNMEVPLAPTP